MTLAAEAEHDGREAQRLGEVRQRRDADAAAYQQRPCDVEPEAVAERAEEVDALARLQRAERRRPRPHRVEEERQLACRREAERQRPRQQPPGRLEHEELARMTGIEAAAVQP